MGVTTVRTDGSRTLAECEAVVERRLATFVEAGAASSENVNHCSAFAYLGSDDGARRFAADFSRFGNIVRHWEP